MAFVYILYSEKLIKHYVGSCVNLEDRMLEHGIKFFKDAFTTKADDWKLLYSLGDLEYEQARKIEAHIKRMKSVKYIQNLITYREVSEKLIQLYKN